MGALINASIIYIDIDSLLQPINPNDAISTPQLLPQNLSAWFNNSFIPISCIDCEADQIKFIEQSVGPYMATFTISPQPGTVFIVLFISLGVDLLMALIGTIFV